MSDAREYIEPPSSAALPPPPSPAASTLGIGETRYGTGIAAPKPPSPDLKREPIAPVEPPQSASPQGSEGSSADTVVDPAMKTACDIGKSFVAPADANWEVRHNNFGGLRVPGVNAPPSQGGFQAFATPEQGVAAIVNQLRRYASGATTGQPLTTLNQIVSTWAPPSENQTGLLIQRAAQWMGVSPDQRLDLNDPMTMAKLTATMIMNEQGGKMPVDPKIIEAVAKSPPDTVAQMVSLAQLGQGWSAQDKATLQRGEAEASKKAKEYSDLAAKAPAGSQEREEALAEARRHAQTAREKFDELSKVPPAYSPKEPFERFGSVAGIIGLLGGLFAKRHLSAALGAAGKAYEAMNQQDFDQYKIAMDQWKTSADLAKTSVSLANEEIRQILDDKRLSVDEKQVELRSKQTEWQMAHTSVEDAYHHIEASQRAMQQFELAQQRLEIQRLTFENKGYTTFEADGPDGKPVTVFGIPGRPDTFKTIDGQPLPEGTRLRKPTAATAASRDAEEQATEVTRRDTEYAKNNPQASDDEKALAHKRHVLETKEEFGVAAGMGRGGPNTMIMRQFINDFTAENGRRPSASEMRAFNASQLAQNSATRAFAAGKEGATVRSLSVAVDHLATLGELAEALQNKDIRAFNAAKNKLATEFGSPVTLEFDAAAPVVGGEVSKAVIGAAGALTDREELRAALQNKNAPEQLRGVIETYKKLMAGQLDGLRRQFKVGTQLGDEEFNKLLSPEAVRELGRVSRTRSDGAPPSSSASIPSDLPDASGMKDGTTAKDATGKVVARVQGGKWVAP